MVITKRILISIAIIASVLIAVSCGPNKPGDIPTARLSASDLSYVEATSINGDNMDDYSVKLDPFEFRIYKIDGLSEPETFNTNPGWWYDAVGYELYVRSFYDSDGDGIGDFQGLTEKLDYLTNLGVDAVWTLPIFNSYHDGTKGRALGYEAKDYYDVDPDYGTFDDFEEYVDEATARDLKLIMDLVINHAATNMPWFQASETNDPYYGDWYIWTNAAMEDLEDAGWGMPWGGGEAEDVWRWNETRGAYYYATWGGELNFNHPAVQEEFFDVARFWIEQGFDGYRMDAIRYLIEEGPGELQADTKSSLEYLERLQAVVKETDPSAMTVGEVWTGDDEVALYYRDGKGFDQCFTFDFMYDVRTSLKYEKASDLVTYLKYREDSAPDYYFAPFVENHDVSRLYQEVKKDDDKAKLAAGILMTFIGTPYLYFGQEIAMKDQYNPMKWDDTENAGFTTGDPWANVIKYEDPYNAEYQMSDPLSLWNLYKNLITYRKSESALRRGDIKVVENSESTVLSYIRTGTNHSVLFVANFSSEKAEAELDLTELGLDPDSEYSVSRLNLRY